jgi:hypothetical protein
MDVYLRLLWEVLDRQVFPISQKLHWLAPEAVLTAAMA